MTLEQNQWHVGVLALQGSVVEHARALRALGAVPVEVKVPSHLQDLDGLIIPGGESTTMYKLARAFDLFDPLKDFAHSGKAIYGSCAGMIMLADHIVDGIDGQETLGGLDVVVRRNAFGRQVDSAQSFVDPGSFGGDQPLPAVFIRAPWVESVGAGVEVLRLGNKPRSRLRAWWRCAKAPCWRPHSTPKLPTTCAYTATS